MTTSRMSSLCRRNLLILCLGLVAVPAGIAARQPAPSTVSVTAVDADGTPVPGACFALDNGRSPVPVFRGCDGDDGAADGATTLYAFDPRNTQVPPGAYVLVEVTAPEGYRVGIRKAIEVVEGETLTPRITQRTGGRTLRVAQVDETGAPLPGGCVLLSRERTLGQPGELVAIRCDADGGADGTISIAGLLAGAYLVLDFRPPPGHTGVTEGYTLVTTSKSRDADLTLTYAQSGDGRVAVVDEAGQPVVGLCLTVVAATATGGRYVCDEWDVGGQDGTIEVRDIRGGTYRVQITAPRGMRPPGDPLVLTITPGEPAAITVTLAAGGQGVVITSLDPDGKPARDDCFGLYPEGEDPRLSVPLIRRCDQEDGRRDGVTVISAEPGEYLLTSGWPGSVLDRTVAVRRNRETEVTITHEPTGAVTATLAMADGVLVPGVCFQAVVATGEPPYRSVALNCDSYGPNADGVATLRGLPPGEVVVFAIDLPRGYQLPAARSVPVEAKERGEVTLTTAKGGESLAVRAVAADEQLVVGACFQILDRGAAVPTAIVTAACDVFDGAIDGTTTVLGLPAGNYLVVQERALEGYGLAEAVDVTVNADETNAIAVTVPLVP